MSQTEQSQAAQTQATPPPAPPIEEYELSGAEILAAQDMKPVKVPCPEWSKDGKRGYVHVRPLASWEAEKWEADVAEAKENNQYMPQQYRAALCLKCLCTADGDPLLSADKLKALTQKSAGPIQRIVKRIIEISGMSNEAVEEAEKNSAPAPGDSSGSS